MKETRKPKALLMQRSVSKKADKVAKDLGVSFNDLIHAATVKINEEHEFISECAERDGLTPLEAEIKFRSDWGL